MMVILAYMELYQNKYVGSNKKQSDRDVFITSEIDKEEVYLGEQITLTFKLYKKVEISVD